MCIYIYVYTYRERDVYIYIEREMYSACSEVTSDMPLQL